MQRTFRFPQRRPRSPHLLPQVARLSPHAALVLEQLDTGQVHLLLDLSLPEEGEVSGTVSLNVSQAETGASTPETVITVDSKWT